MRDDDFTDEEIATRRDEVIRRMANTPPQHRVTPGRPQKKAKATARGRKPVKGGVRPSKS